MGWGHKVKIPKISFGQKENQVSCQPNTIYTWLTIYIAYTPYPPETVLSSADDVELRDQIDEYQETRLFSGVHARELESLGAFPDPRTKSTVLTNPIQYAIKDLEDHFFANSQALFFS